VQSKMEYHVLSFWFKRCASEYCVLWEIKDERVRRLTTWFCPLFHRAIEINFATVYSFVSWKLNCEFINSSRSWLILFCDVERFCFGFKSVTNYNSPRTNFWYSLSLNSYNSFVNFIDSRATLNFLDVCPARQNSDTPSLYKHTCLKL
jgi:hypothetical protein